MELLENILEVTAYAAMAIAIGLIAIYLISDEDSFDTWKNDKHK